MIDCSSKDDWSEHADQAIKELKVYGFTRLQNYLSPDKVKFLLDKINGYFDPEKYKQFTGRQDRELEDKMIYALQAKDKCFIDLLDAPLLEKVLKDFLNDPFYKHIPPEEPNYILSLLGARSSGPKLDLHTDTFMVAPGEKTWTMQVFFVLEDSTVENGCSIVVPGSHLTGKFVDRNLKHVHHLTAKAGDVLIWDSRLWHAAGENMSGASRWLITAVLTCWWVKQRMDSTRSVPDEIYQKLSDKQKVLLGFASIPPKGDDLRRNFKCGYAELLPSVKDYYR